MTDESDIPKPRDSGSDGSQVRADLDVDLKELQPLPMPMARAIQGLATTNARAFGGEVASTLIAGATSQMSVELEQTKQELVALREKNEFLVEALSVSRADKAVLMERIDSHRANRHLKNLGITVGTLLLGVGVQLITSEMGVYGFASLIVGSLLLLLGWHSAPKGGEK